MRLFLLAIGLMAATEISLANISIGTFGPPVGRVREEAESTQGAFSTRSYVGLFYKTQHYFSWIYDLEFAYVFPQESYENMQPKSKSRAMLWRINGNYYFSPLLYAIAGFTTVHTKVYGEGGTYIEGTRTYYLPNEEGQTSYNTILNFGLGFDLSQTYYGEIQTHVWEVLNSQSRAFSISLALKYRIF